MTARIRLRFSFPAFVVVTVVLSACASPDPRYYTLLPDVVADSRTFLPTAPMLIEVAPVRVPEHLNRSNLAIGNGDGSFRLLEQAGWGAPLPDALRDAISERLQTDLSAIDTYHQSMRDAKPRYRINIDVLQMSLELDGRVDVRASWVVTRLADGKAAAGRTERRMRTPGGVAEMVAACRQMIAGTATDVAETLRSLKD